MIDFIKVKLQNGAIVVLPTRNIFEVSSTQDNLIGQCLVKSVHGPNVIVYAVMHSLNDVANAINAFDLSIDRKELH